jgi:hypothetical protein
VDPEQARGYASRVSRALLIIVLLVLWFLPLIIMTLYKLPHQGRIAVLSIALGWTGVAWLAALVIAVAGAIRATEPRALQVGRWPESPEPAQARIARDQPAAAGPPAGPATAPEQSVPSAPARTVWPERPR